MSKLPTFFISHGGGPWPWMEFGEPNPYDGLTRYLRGIAASLPETPKAILVVSGHWEEKSFTVMTSERPPMLYDYGGFPDSTYQVQYPAPGAPLLAKRVSDLLNGAGVSLLENPTRGFDHGTFVPLAVMFPSAEIPVLQLSMQKGYDPSMHLRVGRALEPLRSEGVLIVGSGLSYHNFRGFGSQLAGFKSKIFDQWLTDAVTQASVATRDSLLMKWSEAPSARDAHPREDHLVPLFVAAGAAGQDLGVKDYSDKFMEMEVSGFRFG